MDVIRRRFLTWCGMAAIGGGLGINLSGCGAGLKGSILHAPAQGGARPVSAAVKFHQRDDMGVAPPANSVGGLSRRLMGLVQMSDIHITLDDFTLTGYPELEKLLDQFGEAIGFGGFDRSDPQEIFDIDVLRAVVKTLNASADHIDLVINTGDSLDIGTMPELIAFLSEMNNLDIPWFQTVGNHDRLGLGNIPPGLLNAFSDLDFLDRTDFISKHFPQERQGRETLYGSRAKGFDFSPGFDGFPMSSRGFYAFTALPPVLGGSDHPIRPGVRFYVLNSSRQAGSAMGQVDSEQLNWLSQELAGHPKHLAIVVSHHPLQAMLEGRAELTTILHQNENVVALLCGHDHKHRIMAFAQPGDPARGFWQIQTSSLIDFPQQFRLLEIFDNADGTGTIQTSVFNQQALGELGKNAQASYHSAKAEAFDGLGQPQDRNAALRFKMPLPLQVD